MAKHLNLATIGLDPRDFTSGQVPVADGAGLFAPGEGGGGSGTAEPALVGTGTIEESATSVVIDVTNFPRAPKPGEIQVQPRSVDHAVTAWAVHSEEAARFTVEVSPVPGAGKSFAFGWVWVPADDATTIAPESSILAYAASLSGEGYPGPYPVIEAASVMDYAQTLGAS